MYVYKTMTRTHIFLCLASAVGRTSLEQHQVRTTTNVYVYLSLAAALLPSLCTLLATRAWPLVPSSLHLF